MGATWGPTRWDQYGWRSDAAKAVTSETGPAPSDRTVAAFGTAGQAKRRVTPGRPAFRTLLGRLRGLLIFSTVEPSEIIVPAGRSPRSGHLRILVRQRHPITAKATMPGRDEHDPPALRIVEGERANGRQGIVSGPRLLRCPALCPACGSPLFPHQTNGAYPHLCRGPVGA